MNATTLRVKSALTMRLNGSKLLPSALASLSSHELPRVMLNGAGESIAVDDLFDIAQSDAHRHRSASTAMRIGSIISARI